MDAKKVVVIGAGIGGLSAAYWLRQRGYEVEILEASGRPAGRMVTLAHKGDLVDVGAQFFHTSSRYGFELIRAVGLENTKRKISGKKVQFALRDGSLYLYDHRMPYLKMLGWRGNAKLAWFILRYVFLGRRFPVYHTLRDIPEYDNVRMTEIWGAPADQPLRDFILTTIGASESGATLDQMSLYDFVRSLRITMFSSFVGLTGGIASLAEELARRLPVRFETPVRRVVVEKGRVVGAELEGSGSVRKADHVVAAVTPPAAASLLTEELAEQRRFFQSIPVTPQVIPVFFLNRRLREDVWSYFTDPGLQRPFLFAVDEHNKIPEMSPRGNAILTLWPGEQMPPEWVRKPDEDLLREARKDLEVMLPGVSSSIEEGLVVRHPYVMASCSVGSIGRIIDFRRRAERLKGISFVGDVFGIGMEGAMASAAEAVRRICGNGAAVGPPA